MRKAPPPRAGGGPLSRVASPICVPAKSSFHPPSASSPSHAPPLPPTPGRMATAIGAPPSNWSPASPPRNAANENIFLTASDGVSRTITFDNAVPLITFGVLDVDLTGAGSNFETLSIVSGNLNTTSQEVGEVGRGAVIHTGGNNTLGGPSSLSLGDTIGAFGSYALSGGDLSVGGNELVGNNGTGIMTVSGTGIDTVGGNITIGTAANGNGTFSIINFGNASAASLAIGSSAGGKGVFNISGGSFQTLGNVTIANTAGSALNISGGIFSVAAIKNSNSPGAVQFTGGELSLTSQNADFAANSTADPSALLLPNTFTFNSGQVLVTTSGWVWLRSAGTTVTQVTSSQILTNSFYIGNQTGAGANAVYNLNGGFLTITAAEFIGYVGMGGVSGGGATINQTAGSNSVANMYLGYNGPATYNQSDGNVTVSNDFEMAPISATATYNLSGGLFTTPVAHIGGNAVAGAGTGVLTISGTGSMTVAGTTVIYNTAGTSLNLAGGSLTTSNINFSGNASLFHWTGGSLHLTNQTLDITSAIDPNALFGSSLSIGFGQSLTVDLGETATAPGNAISQSGGFHNTLSVSIGNSTGAGPATSYTMTAGIFLTYTLCLGNGGPGVFSQSAGTTGCNQFVCGQDGPGTFNLSGTAVFTANSSEVFGVSGSIANQTGGTNNFGFDFGFPDTPGNVTYNFSGGSIIGGGPLSVGGYLGAEHGLGVFNMSGSASLTIPSLVIFAPVGNDFNFNGGTISAGALNFNGNPANFNWTAGTLQITAGVTWDANAGPNATGSAFGTALTLGPGKTLGVAADETLGGSGVFSLTLNAGSTNTVSGILTLSGNGAITLNGGTLNVSNLNLAANPTKFIWNSGTLNINNDVTWDGSVPSTSTGGTFGSALTLNANQVLSITGNETIGGAGPFTLTLNPASGSLHSVTGNITLNANGTYINNSGFIVTYNTFIQNGGTISGPAINTLYNTDTFIYNSGLLNGQLRNLGNAVIGGSAVFSPTNGIINDGILNVGNGSVSVSGGSFINSGTIQLAGGSIDYNTGSTFLLFGETTGFGIIASSAGLAIQGQIIQGNGEIFIESFATAANAGDIEIAPSQVFDVLGPFNNNGIINLHNGSFAAYSTVNSVTGVISGSGIVYGNISNAGLVELDAGLLQELNYLTNTGTIQLNGASAVLSALSITSSGTIQGFGRITAPVANTGTIEAIGGVLTIAGALTNTGTLAAATGNKILTQNFPTNPGVISLSGGTFDSNGQPLDNTGQISGFGTVRTGGLTNDGILTFTGGTTTINGPVTNSAGRTILIKNDPAVFTGNVTNNGTIKTTGTLVTFTGNYTGNTYISDPATNIFQANATVIPGGSMTGGPGDAFLFNTFTNNGSFQNGGNLSVSAGITNTSTFTQSGPQSWSPGATFTNTSGIANFQSNAKLYGLTITAGTVDITNSKFIIEATTNKATTLALLQSDIAAHSLISSTLPANFALALLDNALLNKTTFGNNPADANSLLLSPELLGDANADGHVDLSDLSTILNNFGQLTPNWTDGNFDHTPTIDLTDLSDVLNNFGLTNPNPSGTLPIPTPTPEPASLALFALSSYALLIRTRR